MNKNNKVHSSVESIETIEQQGALNDAEQRELADCEKKVASGTAKAAMALKTIHDGKLYRAEYQTWEEYVVKRWRYCKSYSHQVLKFAAVCEMIERAQKSADGTLLVMPTGERQVRPLASLANDAQRLIAWSLAVEQAGGKVPFGTQVEQAVAQVRKGERNPRKSKTSTAQVPATAGSTGTDEAERQEDTPESDAAEAMNVSDDAIMDVSGDISHQDAQHDAQDDETDDASIAEGAPAPEPRDDDRAMQEQDTDHDENSVDGTAQDRVAEASGEVEEAAMTNNEPTQSQASPAPPRRQATPERVERANKLAKICRDAVAGQVSEDEAALIFDLLRTSLAEQLA